MWQTMQSAFQSGRRFFYILLGMFEIVKDELAKFETELSKQLDSSVAFIDAISEDLVSAGGKRVRPSLAFIAGKMLNGKLDGTELDDAVQDNAVQDNAMTVALAVELLHSASLLHDDLIDDADTRRGKEAAFRRYGNVVSVFSGDFMLAKVLGLLAKANNQEFTALMSQTAADICEAEVLQFQMASLETYSMDNYFQIITGKTAVLIKAALEGVAILSGASLEQREAFKEYSLAYGRAFQMQDDYLDLLGNEEQLGKPIGGDLREGKATYTVLKLLLERESTEAQEILRRHAAGENDVALMQELVQTAGLDIEAKQAIVAEAERAKEALSIFPESEAKQVLMQLAERELERAK